MNRPAILALVIALSIVLVASRSLTQDHPVTTEPAVQPTTADEPVAQGPAAAEPIPDPPVIEDVDLQALIDQAEDGDTITIATGTYITANGLVIEDRKDLTIICESPVNIFCENTDANVLSIKSSMNITLAGARLRHVEPLEEYECHGSVVSISDSTNVLIYRCELDGCGAVGASISDSREVHVHECYVHDNSFVAFYVSDSTDVRITDSRIINNMSMFSCYGRESLGVRMWGNTIENNTGYWELLREEKVDFARLDEKIGTPIEAEE